jgi:von Hippel-Lindau disease tumor supressor
MSVQLLIGENPLMPLTPRKTALLLVTTLMLSTPIAAFAQTRHPAEEKGVKSLVGGKSVETSIKFINKGSQPIKVYWLNYEGNRVLYGELKTGETLPIVTFLTHPWLITDSSDNAKSIFFPDDQPRVIEIP